MICDRVPVLPPTKSSKNIGKRFPHSDTRPKTKYYSALYNIDFRVFLTILKNEILILGMFSCPKNEAEPLIDSIVRCEKLFEKSTEMDAASPSAVPYSFFTPPASPPALPATTTATSTTRGDGCSWLITTKGRTRRRPKLCLTSATPCAASDAPTGCFACSYSCYC